MKDLRKTEFKTIAYASILSIMLSLYYLLIFKFTWGSRSQFTFEMKKFSEITGSIFPKLLDFNYIIVLLILLGIIAAILFLKNKGHPAVLAAMFMFAIGFTHLIGFGHRALQNRYFWPIYLSVFVGIIIYTVFKKIVKNNEHVIAYALSLILLIVFSFSFYEKNDSPGLMDDYHWQMFNFLKTQTNEKSKVAFLWGDVFNQKAILLNAHRQSFFVIDRDYFQAINERKINKEYNFDVITEQLSPHKITLTKYEFYSPPVGMHDICKFDYYAMDILPQASQIPAAIQYNLVIRELLLKNEFIHEVFNNQVTSIVKNNKPGEDCIEPVSF